MEGLHRLAGSYALLPSTSGFSAFSGQRSSSSTARSASTQSMPMASRVSTVALPRCGASTTFSSVEQARVHLGLALVDVERGARDLALAQRVGERRLVHDRAPRRVDEERPPAACGRSCARVDQVPRLGRERAVEADDVRGREQLVERQMS